MNQNKSFGKFFKFVNFLKKIFKRMANPLISLLAKTVGSIHRKSSIISGIMLFIYSVIIVLGCLMVYVPDPILKRDCFYLIIPLILYIIWKHESLYRKDKEALRSESFIILDKYLNIIAKQDELPRLPGDDLSKVLPNTGDKK